MTYDETFQAFHKGCQELLAFTAEHGGVLTFYYGLMDRLNALNHNLNVLEAVHASTLESIEKRGDDGVHE